MESSFYDIDGIIKESLRSKIDISPADRKDWTMFCCALKVLGYDESTFVALSSGSEKDSRRAWRNERSPQRYATTESAVKKIVALAKAAGMDVKPFLLSQMDKPTADRAERRPRPQEKPTPPKEPRPVFYISPDMIRAGHLRANETSFYKFLCSEFAAVDVDRVISAYRIGAAKYINPQGGRATVFPYIDTSGRCVDCKIFHLNPTTGSRKDAPPLATWTDKDGRPQALKSSWALFELRDKEGKRMNDRRAPWCNFGDHLLAQRPAAPIGIVESEKTAVIASIVYPGIVWLAVGSINNLNPERCAPCRGRNVTVYPDRDGFESWRDKAAELAKSGITVSIDTTTLRHYPEFMGVDEKGNPDKCRKDLADLILDYRHGAIQPPQNKTQPDPYEEARILWEGMKRDNPLLAEVERSLDLDISTARVFNHFKHDQQ